MSGFFDELKRRKVYRVAIAYIVASWALAQGLSQVLPVFEVPNSVIRVVIALLLTGFPVALVLAWVFDITPTGIRRTAAVGTQSVPGAHRRRNLFMLAAAGVVISACIGFFVLPRAAARKIDKSIAVLPFENLSDEKENAYFADGIQDDVLTNLSKIGDLKVISRTSVMPYRGKLQNLRDIGKTLGVANILEGSVRRSGNKVRVNVQLIDATNDQHLWAEDYDGDLSDVFKIQTDLATKIASALQAKLSPTEKEHMERKPTENGQAYLTFVEAQNVYHSAIEDFGKLKQGEQLYARAIELDPKFALAYARYSQLESWIVHTFERTLERREKARDLAQRALELQPNLPEAHLAMGFSYYYGDNDFDAALKEFQIAQRGLPNESEVYLDIGSIFRREGKWPESTSNLEKSVSLDPHSVWPLQNLAFNYMMLRDYDQANKIIDRGLALDPTALGLWEVKSKAAIAEKGDFSVAEKGFAAAKSISMTNEQKLRIAGARAEVFLLERKFKEGLRESESLPDEQVAAFPGALCGKYYFIGIARKSLGDESGAQAAFLRAKSAAAEQLNRSPDAPEAHMQLARVLAYLNEKDSALAQAQRASELLPESKDAFGGPEIAEGVAQVHAILGDSARAIEILDGLLSRPSAVTIPGLKTNPVWDPIRNDPQFQALIEKYGAKV